MTTKEVAERLNGCEYADEGGKELFDQAAQEGIVIVFGGSDDLMEFRGAINDELYVPGTAYLNQGGLIENKCRENDECPYYLEARKQGVTIEALWGQEGYSWTYKTDIQHETFDVLEDGEKYCRGIVFYLHNAARI